MAHLVRRVRAFAGAPLARKALALEAGWQLLRARLATLRPAKTYTAMMGRLGAEAQTAAPGDLALAREIGHVVAVAARALPFRTLCLQQVLAVRFMLRRRDIPAVVFLGVHRDPARRSGEGPAHAWIAVSGCVVNGDLALDQYVTVGTFA